MVEERPLPRVLEFMQRLWALDHALQSRSKQMEAHLGITAPQRLVLRILGEFPGLAPSELAETLHLHRSTLTGVLKRLEDAGLVARTSKPTDLRSYTLELTSEGAAFNTLREGTVEATVDELLADITEAQRTAFGEVLEKLIAGLETPVQFRPVPRPAKSPRARVGRARP